MLKMVIELLGMVFRDVFITSHSAIFFLILFSFRVDAFVTTCGCGQRHLYNH